MQDAHKFQNLDENQIPRKTHSPKIDSRKKREPE